MEYSGLFYVNTGVMRLKREHIGNLIAVSAAVLILAAAWITSSPGFWPAVIGGISGPIGAVLIMRWMNKFQDERFTHVYNKSSRNAFVFLVFALPYLGAILALQSIAVEAVGLILLVWIMSIVIAYISGIYYYKQ